MEKSTSLYAVQFTLLLVQSMCVRLFQLTTKWQSKWKKPADKNNHTVNEMRNKKFCKKVFTIDGWNSQSQ